MHEPPDATPPSRPHPRPLEIISWLVIGMVIGVIIGLPYLGPPAGIAPDGADSQLKLIGRYLVGMKMLLPGIMSSPNGQDQFKTMLLEAARTPTERLRATAVLGE